ncbi:hypothetical protein LTR86_005536 [Recurvomyces mirabilis]|nr:hypothetical protein LTR86_005536 [Recurvomyces mirabilis]
MLWYLLYPLCGTTQPPRLSANHPIRRAFYRHGKTTAQHWLVAMLVSVAIAMGFSYPTIFLAENPTAGFAAYPHHVWTSAKPFDGDSRHIDVEMRQIWVHGSYMKALDKDVLKSALSIQERLVGDENLTDIFPALDEKLRSSKLSWGYHSPLMYWNSSAQMIDHDTDIVDTINAQAGTPSSLNVALRPASVFAGKVFDRRKLRAADALVLTFMNKVRDGVGGSWQQKMKTIKPQACDNCTLFPSDGDVTRNQVYEFSFTPLSLQENLALTFAYSMMALYVLMSLRRLKAFHSRFGLVVTAITQMTCSVLASFTICGILKINLSMIPQNAYPFVVLVIGLENMFRLINAVLAYPATLATDQRIANALGDIGPICLATAAQNVIILAILASFVSPGVAAFCAFACIATLFDVFFLLTFFVAVLNVDIRRLELQDALARANQQHKRRARKPSPSQHTWFDALVRGRLPFSTRMAGTAVTTTFIISLNYHFFERHEKVTSITHLLGLAKGGPKGIAEFDTFSPPPMNATLTPGEWMRMQDFDTAREVMRLAKPGADSFVIRVFAPLIVVLSGADRTGAPIGTEAWMHALTSFAVHHFYQVAVAIVFAVTFVTVLMNFLLYSEPSDDNDNDNDRPEEGLTVQSFSLPHRLDVVRISGNESGHFVTVALDRTIAVAVFDRAQKAYSTLSIPPEVLQTIHWPVHSAVIDDNAEWLACHCGDDKILLYNCKTNMIASSVPQFPDDNPAIIFRLMRLSSSSGQAKIHLVVLTSGGRILCRSVDSLENSYSRVSDVPLLGGRMVAAGSCIVVSEDCKLIVLVWSGSDFIIDATRHLSFTARHGRLSGAVNITHFPGSETNHANDFLLTHGAEVLLSRETGEERMPLAQCSTGTIAGILLPNVSKCQRCGGPALLSISLVCEAQDSEAFSVEVPVKEESNNPLCLQRSSIECGMSTSSQRTIHDIRNAGVWTTIPSHGVIGLRRKAVPEDAKLRARASNTLLGPRLRNHQRIAPPQDVIDEWEAYKYTSDGEVETVELRYSPAADGQYSLYVHKAGPVAHLDDQSIAVAFGNTVKIIRSFRMGRSNAYKPNEDNGH